MKTTLIASLVAIASLSAAGSAVAGAHDGYQRAFLGYETQTNTVVGKAAFGTPSDNAWSGHEAYQRALGSDNGSAPAKVDVMGKAAFGTSTGPDGHAAYRAAFNGNG
jgi:hypothetical protein